VTPFVVYSDFNCPFCYALNEHLLALGVTEQLSWRGVQHAPGLPVPMAVWNEDLADDLEREVEAVRRLTPALPIEAPPGKPNTTRAIRAAALAVRLDPPRGHAFKNLLYQALWCRGADLSHPDTLEQLAREAGCSGLPCAELDRHEIAAVTSGWQDEWEESGCRAVPAILRQDGARMIGLTGRAQIARFFQRETESRTAR